MNDATPSWSLIELSAEAREAAERAAFAAGMSLDDWLAQLIKYRSTMELREDARRRLQTAGAVAVPIDPPTAPTAPARAAPAEPPKPAKPTAEEPKESETLLTAPPPLPGTPAARRPPRFGPQSKDSAEPAPPKPMPLAAAAMAAPAAPAKQAAEKPANEKPASEKPALARPPAEPAAAPRSGDLPPPRMTPTDHLAPARLAALGPPREEEIQAALERWRGSGMLEPLIVRPRAGAPGQYEIVAGAERWHAARRAYVRAIPTIEYDCADAEAIELGLVDRLRRAPASPLVEANAYMRLMEDAGLPIERVARLAGKPVSHVGTMVRLLALPKPVREAIDRGALSLAHARLLLDAPNAEAIARDIVDRRLDIFQAEQLVRLAKRAAAPEADTVAVADIAEAVVAEEAEGELALAAVEMAAPAEAVVAAGAPLAEASAGGLVARRAPAPPRLPPDIARQAERNSAAERSVAPERSAAAEPRGQAADVVSTELLERKLAAAFGLKVAISEREGVGLVCLHYTTREELQRILARLNLGAPDRREQG